MAESTGTPSATQDVSAGPGDSTEVLLLTFKDNLWDRFDFLWQNRVEPSRKILDEFLQALRDRAQLEKHYAKGLARSTSRLEACAPPGSLPEVMEAVAVNMRNRSEQSLKLAEDLEVDVCDTMAAMLRQHAEVSKRVFADGRKVSEAWQDARRQHDASASRYAMACLEAEAAVHDAANSSRQNRLAVHSRIPKLQRQAVQAEREYYQAIQHLNAITENHKRSMGHVLEALQQMEEKRVMCFNDTAMKLAVYDVSWLRNMQYDLDGVIKILESADGLRDLQDWIRQHQSKAAPYAKVQPQAFWDLPAASTASVSASSSRKGSEVEFEAVSRWQTEVVEPAVRSLLPGGDSEAGHEAVLELRRGFTQAPTADESAPIATSCETAPKAPTLGASMTRSLFFKVLEGELGRRSRAAGTERGLEALAPTAVTHASFDDLVSLFTACLDGCGKDADYWCSGRLLAFLKLVYCTIDGKDVSILLRVYDHSLWSSMTFWESALLVGIFEAQAASTERRRRLGAGSKIEEVAMSPFLQRFVQHMVSLGIKQEQAVSSVKNYLRKFVNILGQPLAEGYMEQVTRGAPPPSPIVAPHPAPSAAAATTDDALSGTSPQPVVAGTVIAEQAKASTLCSDDSAVPKESA